MPEEFADEELADTKRDIPSFDDTDGKREVDTTGKGMLQIVNESLNEYRTSIKAEFAALEARVSALEKP